MRDKDARIEMTCSLPLYNSFRDGARLRLDDEIASMTLENVRTCI